MRKNLLIAGIALLLFNNFVPAQTNLSWSSSFSPSWSHGNTSGTANNIGGSGINASVTTSIVGPGSFQPALGSSGSQTPTVSGATFTIPGTTNRLQITPNYSNRNSYTNIVLGFTSMAYNVTFKIADIDKSDPNSTTYFDRVTITGTNGVTVYNPTITKYDPVTDPNFLVISGNRVNVNTTDGEAGNSASDASDQRGTVIVSFGNVSVNSITIRYDNAPGTDNNTASQAIAIGSVSFTNATLPIHLSSFNGNRQAQDVVLNWKTEQESNSSSFNIERNTGNSWETIGTVLARGNTNNLTRYTYTDPNPAGTLLLYRLKQIDIDNNYSYSGIVRITGKESKTILVSYPNPFSDQMNININSAGRQEITTAIYDGTGKRIRSEAKNLYPGNNNFTINGLDRLGSGIYHIEITDRSGSLIGQTKMIKN